MQEIQIKLSVFEGPLDLLLHLIQKLELDIYDIPIAEVTDQYIQYIHTMKTLELEVAGEYLVMAATLMAIKSQMLLPTEDVFDEYEEEYEDDPRDVLIAQLVEYRKYKYAAEQLADKASERHLSYTKEPLDLDPYREEQAPLDPNQFNTIDLFLAFHQMLAKKKQRSTMMTKITNDETSIEDKMLFIEQRLTKATGGEAFDSFMMNDSKAEIVVTFMALLELMKKQKVRIEQINNFDTILLYPVGE